ncbi:MAG: hypothetical protein ABWZ83_05040 [Mesorhizobium sp.]|jgi:hypothetical protein
MLARRFTIVCLITALFGLFFALLVADAGRSDHHRGIAAPCAFSCTTPRG